MTKLDNKAGEEMSMEDILASIRKLMAQDQDIMDKSKSDQNSGLPSGEFMQDDEVLELIDELPEDGMILQQGAVTGQPDSRWDAPPEENAPEFVGDMTEEPLDLQSEFAIQDEDAPAPVETAAEPEPAVEEPWAVQNDTPYSRQPVTVGLTDMMEPVIPSNNDQPLENLPRYLDEPLPVDTQTAYVGGQNESVVEATTGEPVESPDEPAFESHEEVVSMDAPKERIVSPEAAIKTSAAFDQLAQTLVSGYEGEGNTLEAVVRGMLKPLMKEWLDANLPRIVEDMIQAEIRRLSR
jgi:cell pole-organizing protein PopZ